MNYPLCASDSRLPPLMAFASDLADLAALETMARFRQPLSVDNKESDSGFDPVTLADQRAEAVMRDHIATNWPNHGFLGEESGSAGDGGGFCWVIDPIDGTRAFITGLPLWGTLIALAEDGEPVLGVADQPYLAERYLGGPDGSVCRQRDGEQQLRTRQCESVADALMMTTDPSMFAKPAEQAAFAALRSAVRMARFGGDCYAYMMLARGHIDLVVEAELEPYDIQALIPIVRGAGGVVSNWRGGSAAGGGQVVAAGSAALHEQALAILAAGAD
jgi:myo-inositol-1(or 4)-monophosphatase